MLDRTSLLAILALPAGVGVCLGVTAVIGGLPLPSGLHGILLAIGPLFAAGLAMAALLLPAFDRMARRDLAAHRGLDQGGADHGAGHGADGMRSEAPPPNARR